MKATTSEARNTTMTERIIEAIPMTAGRNMSAGQFENSANSTDQKDVRIVRLNSVPEDFQRLDLLGDNEKAPPEGETLKLLEKL